MSNHAHIHEYVITEPPTSGEVMQRVYEALVPTSEAAQDIATKGLVRLTVETRGGTTINTHNLLFRIRQTRVDALGDTTGFGGSGVVTDHHEVQYFSPSVKVELNPMGDLPANASAVY